MNDRIKELAEQAGVGFMFDPDAVVLTFKMEKFAESIVDACCLKLLDMHDKTKGQHNYYKHAALEVKRYLGT